MDRWRRSATTSVIGSPLARIPGSEVVLVDVCGETGIVTEIRG